VSLSLLKPRPVHLSLLGGLWVRADGDTKEKKTNSSSEHNKIFSRKDAGHRALGTRTGDTKAHAR